MTPTNADIRNAAHLSSVAYNDGLTHARNQLGLGWLYVDPVALGVNPSNVDQYGYFDLATLATLLLPSSLRWLTTTFSAQALLLTKTELSRLRFVERRARLICYSLMCPAQQASSMSSTKWPSPTLFQRCSSTQRHAFRSMASMEA